MSLVSIKIIEENNFSEENKLGRGGFGEVYRVENHYDMKCIFQFLGVELDNHFFYITLIYTWLWTCIQGRLFNGQETIVKRLSRNSRQGDLEFKNEVLLVAKFQNTKI